MINFFRQEKDKKATAQKQETSKARQLYQIFPAIWKHCACGFKSTF